MKKRIVNALIRLTIILAVAGTACGLLLRYAFPEYYFPLYPAVPGFYLALGLFLIVLLTTIKTRKASAILNRYMILRLVKIVLCLVAILLYLKLVDVQRNAFIITFLLFYLIFMLFEIQTISRFEKRLREKVMRDKLLTKAKVR